MFDWIRALVLRVLRVPHEPTPPIGAPGSVRIFRAGRSFYHLRLIRWGLGQVVGVIGVCFSLVFFSWFKDLAESARAATQSPAAPVTTSPPVAHRATAPAELSTRARRLRGIAEIKQVAARTTPWMIIGLEIFEGVGVLLFLAQIPVSFIIVRLEFELHWYIVTDRSLRIRTGVLRLAETTMSFANLQQVEVKQGPLQRLLGLADVRVQSAGGGDRGPHETRERDSLHIGVFHCVDNATEIRDLIQERLRQFRQAGLGDHDDRHEASAAMVPPPGTGTTPDSLAAAREVLAEARALRLSLTRT